MADLPQVTVGQKDPYFNYGPGGYNPASGPYNPAGPTASPSTPQPPASPAAAPPPPATPNFSIPQTPSPIAAAFSDAGIATSALPSYESQITALQTEEAGIKSKEDTRLAAIRGGIESDYATRERQQRESGAKAVGGAEAQLAGARGAGFSSARVQFLNDLTNENEKLINDMLKQKESLLETANMDEADRISKQVNELRDRQFNLRKQAFDERYKTVEFQRRSYESDRDYQLRVAELQQKAAESGRQYNLDVQKTTFDQQQKAAELGISVEDLKLRQSADERAQTKSTQDIQDKQRTTLIDNLSQIGNVGGTIPDDLKASADAMFGPGFSDQYQTTAKQIFTAKTDADNVKAAEGIANLLGKYAVGKEIKINGQKYQGTDIGGLKMILEPDAKGNIHQGTFKVNPQTGQYELVGEIKDLGPIGKPQVSSKIWTDPDDPTKSYFVDPVNKTITPVNAAGATAPTSPTEKIGSAASVNNVSGIKDASGKFAVSSTPQESFQNTVDDIKLKQSGGSKTGLTGQSTLDQFVKTWIQGKDQNIKMGYTAQNVSDYLKQQGVKNINPNTPISQIDAQKLATAVAHFETGYDANAGVFTGKAGGQVDYKQYGLLANTNFNKGNRLDSAARLYLDSYLKTGTMPSYTTIFGRSSKTGELTMAKVEERVQDLMTQATGSPLPDKDLLKTNKALIAANNKILNNNELQADIVTRNFDLAIQGEMTNDVNQNATIINQKLNPIYLALGDPAVNQALVSNGTISQEFANLISIRNAQGTTVADKEMANHLIAFGTSVEAQKAVVERLKAEAVNIQEALKKQTGDLWSQIDPLETSAQNPNRQDKLDKLKGITTLKDKTRWQVQADGSYKQIK